MVLIHDHSNHVRFFTSVEICAGLDFKRTLGLPSQGFSFNSSFTIPIKFDVEDDCVERYVSIYFLLGQDKKWQILLRECALTSRIFSSI